MNYYQKEHQSIELSDMSDKQKYYAHMQIENEELEEYKRNKAPKEIYILCNCGKFEFDYRDSGICPICKTKY